MRIVLTSLLLLAMPVAALAQGAGTLERADAVPTPAALNLELDGSSSAALGSQLLRVVGGAAVGAWVGFMASQVAVGDWEDDPNIQRGNWAVGGAALGVTLGLTIPSGRTPPARATRAPTERPGRELLTAEQIEEAKGGSLYHVIQSLRPEWLRTRGTGSMRETARGSASGLGGGIEIEQAAIPTIRAYLDNSLLGDAETLRNIDPGLVGEVRFLNTAEATHRFGAGHIHGAILVFTASGQ